MSTIVEYTSSKAPRNAYPFRIVSPPQPSGCCFFEMEEVGEIEQDDRWEYVYKRCRSCGFTLRVVVRVLPDAGRIESLRHTLSKIFRRRAPDP